MRAAGARAMQPAVGTSLACRALSRRRVLAGTMALATGAPLSYHLPASAAAPTKRLLIEPRTIEVLGRAASVLGLRQPDGTTGIVLEPGERFAVELENRLREETIIHWHGQTPPYPLDGVVDQNNPSLRPGEVRRYEFAARSGTHWMHSHLGLQEQLLLAAPLIVRSPDDAAAGLQEATILLADFTFRDPAEILAELQRGATKRGAAGPEGAMPPHASMPGMSEGPGSGGEPLDLNDVDYDAFLANDRTLEDPDVIRVDAGTRVRLRLINGATTSAFQLDLGWLAGTLVAVDGNPAAVQGEQRLALAPAQRLDVLIAIPQGGGSYPILAQREGDTARTGVILATRGAQIAKVASRATAPAPALDNLLESHLAAVTVPPQREADVTHRIRLTGDMARYVWSIDDRVWGEHRPLPVRMGQRVAIEMRNETLMAHPMHLHGHHFQVVAINGRRLQGAVRDTVLVLPRSSVTVTFDADNPGRWFLHCHNLLHRDVGMQTEVTYAA